MLQATLVDTWASTAAGAFALSENNLYTTDAFHDYLSHLTDDGLLAFTRWGFEPPRESLRLISLAWRRSRDLGETDAAGTSSWGARARVSRGWGAQDTVLISRKPFTAEDIERARQTHDRRPAWRRSICRAKRRQPVLRAAAQPAIRTSF